MRKPWRIERLEMGLGARVFREFRKLKNVLIVGGREAELRAREFVTS